MLTTRTFHSALLFLSVILYSCHTNEKPDEKKEDFLLPEDRALCELMKIDSSLIKLLREKTSSKLDKYSPEPLWVYSDDGSMVERPSELKGIYFEATPEAAKRYIGDLSAQFQAKGHTIYLCEQNYGLGGLKDKVAIVPTSDKYTILKETGTDGINYDIDNDSLLKIIHEFDAKYNLTLIGCNVSWCEFTFEKEPMNWITMAEECYAVCPDVVDQGTETVEILAEELKRTKTIYLWWD